MFLIRNIYLCIIYTPNLGLAITILVREGEHSFVGNIEGARESIKGARGSTEGARGSSEGAERAAEGSEKRMHALP